VKLRCERDVLTEALAICGRAVANRGGAMPVLSGVRFELAGDRLTLTGSDLELTVSVEVAVNGIADGVAVLPSRLASDIVKALPAGAVEISVEDDTARITAGRSEFTLRLLAADEFPRIADVQGDEVSFAREAFVAALRQVLPAASSDDSRPILTGVLLTAEEGGLRLVATDSYRLAVRDLPGVSVLSAGRRVLVPSRALGELSRALSDSDEITLRLGSRDASEGEFPNYQGIIPQSPPNTLTVGKSALLDALRRVKLLARDATPVRLAMSADGLELIAVTQEVGEGHESVDATYAGEDLTVAFNPDYLLAGVEAADADAVTLSTIDALKAAVVRMPGRDDFLYLLMPIRVQ
jgi:DNA polymerase-3 subunit beta